jgi:hypothetical protein
MFGSYLRRFRRLGTRGAAAVEFALVTPMLITLSVGGIDYGNLLNGSQAIAAAARVGIETARNDTDCKSGIQVLNNPQVGTDCKNAIETAMQASGNFSPALIFPSNFTLTCKCDKDLETILCPPPSGNSQTFGNSCATPTQASPTGRGNNMVFITVSASQIVSPLITWPFFPNSINGLATVRLQ